MFTIISAILACCTTLQLSDDSHSETPNKPPNATARDLYQQAATAIAANSTDDAITPLEELTSRFAESELAETALPHLLECYLIAKRPSDALALVEKEASYLSSERLRTLAVLACRTLPEDEAAAARVQEHLDKLNEQTVPIAHHRELCRLLSQRYEKLRDYHAALDCLHRLPTDERSKETCFRLALAWAHHERMRDHNSQAIELLREILDADLVGLSVEQQAAVRFELAEAYLSDQQMDEASYAFAELGELAEQVTAETQFEPEWSGSVLLRRAEVCVMNRRYVEALAIVREAKAKHSAFPKLHEFDFLAARCAIADIDFDKALMHLNAVEQAPSADLAAIARATWMQGEVFFLQRNYHRALEAYERTVGMRGCEQWQARSLVQAGKCHELLKQPLNALVAYERLLRDCSEENTWGHSIRSEATERIASLKNTTEATRQQ